MASAYDVQFEVEGPAAMFARPDTGSTPISYPVPTFSAAKGMFEAVLRRPHVYVQPTLVEICENRKKPQICQENRHDPGVQDDETGQPGSFRGVFGKNCGG